MIEIVEKKTEAVWLRIAPAAFDVAVAVDFLRVERAGGIDLFLGTTRRFTGDAETVELAYEAYPAMALREMGRLAEEAAARWPAERIVVWHRLGVVPLAEGSVLIGVATPHRADAFEACRFLIDQLKIQVPIWKKEHYADGTTEWVEGATPVPPPEPPD